MGLPSSCRIRASSCMRSSARRRFSLRRSRGPSRPFRTCSYSRTRRRPECRSEDLEETANYIAALNHGVNSIASGQLPLCNRLLREVHERLLCSGRGADKAPGEFRRSQNWLGGTGPGDARFVPPPWEEVEPAMSDLERFLHDMPAPTPVLVKAALSHVQFETIHPFLDGNGRVGRLLITLLLVDQGVLKRPLLYLSLYLKRNRDAYYEYLQRVRTEGAWEEWLRFFLAGVVDVAESTAATTRGIVEMIERDRTRIHEFGRGAATALRVHDLAVKRVVVKPPNGGRSPRPVRAPGLHRDRPTGGGGHPPRGNRPGARQDRTSMGSTWTFSTRAPRSDAVRP